MTKRSILDRLEGIGRKWLEIDLVSGVAHGYGPDSFQRDYQVGNELQKLARDIHEDVEREYAEKHGPTAQRD